ncbi:MAG: protein phosphatase 2C domain-containing protein [Mediterranea sp.]|jgi:protein phosphatase|nr:protein phosphatase 2C domain-containing protein [Mediterranea sp.]
MKVTIHQPLAYTAIGQRENQEDSLYPIQGTTASRFFIVCDGMGGHAHGEVAANTVCQALGDYLASHPLITLDEEELDAAIDAAYDALDDADDKSMGGERKMGTTLALAYLHHRGCTAAHIGDSRIYHVRPNAGILYRSPDHSLVEDLVRLGELTPEEARYDRRRNIITRVMMPHQEERQYAETRLLTDLRAGDYLFLCTDGVLERLTDERLLHILSEDLDDEEKACRLQAVSTGQTRDNHTAYLVHIAGVSGDDKPGKRKTFWDKLTDWLENE